MENSGCFGDRVKMKEESNLKMTNVAKKGGMCLGREVGSKHKCRLEETSDDHSKPVFLTRITE